MLSFRDVVRRPDFSVTTVSCRHDHTRWSAVEQSGAYRVVLVRRGRFRRRADGVPVDVDPTMAYVGTPGEEEHFAHPAGGDQCTLINVAPGLWRSVAGETAGLSRAAVYVDAKLDLAHRRMLAAADDAEAVADQLMVLLGQTVGQVVGGATPAGAGRSPADAAIVASAREAISAGHPQSQTLTGLAGLLRVSPFRLSRAFTRELGVSLTRYRNRFRLGVALDRLEHGESSLAGLAAELGFADQAHLCRTMRDHLGHTPAALRRLLSRAQVERDGTPPGHDHRPGAPARPQREVHHQLRDQRRRRA